MRVVHRGPSPAVPEGLLPTAEDLERVRDLADRFGLRPAQALPLDLGRRPGPDEPRLWLVLESMQVTGSFKVRGAMHAIVRRREAFRQRAVGSAAEPFVVVAASAGNHGVGVAYAAAQLGVEAHIVVPRDAARTKIDKIAAAGAHVIISSSPGYDDAEKEAIALANERGAPFISPYDDIDVLVGNGASLAFEIVRALGRIPSVVYCPIGGGGLASGLAYGLRHEARARGEKGALPAGAPLGMVIPVQAEAASAFALSLERGAAVTEQESPPTIAEGLAGGISTAAFERARAVIDRAVVCEEREIEDALRAAVRELGLVIEGSSAVALVPVLKRDPLPAGSKDVVVVLTGRNIDPDKLDRILSG